MRYTICKYKKYNTKRKKQHHNIYHKVFGVMYCIVLVYGTQYGIHIHHSLTVPYYYSTVTHGFFLPSSH